VKQVLARIAVVGSVVISGPSLLAQQAAPAAAGAGATPPSYSANAGRFGMAVVDVSYIFKNYPKFTQQIEGLKNEMKTADADLKTIVDRLTAKEHQAGHGSSGLPGARSSGLLLDVQRGGQRHQVHRPAEQHRDGAAIQWRPDRPAATRRCDAGDHAADRLPKQRRHHAGRVGRAQPRRRGRACFSGGSASHPAVMCSLSSAGRGGDLAAARPRAL
jgi:hypothetical protein